MRIPKTCKACIIFIVTSRHLIFPRTPWCGFSLRVFPFLVFLRRRYFTPACLKIPATLFRGDAKTSKDITDRLNTMYGTYAVTPFNSSISGCSSEYFSVWCFLGQPPLCSHLVKRMETIITTVATSQEPRTRSSKQRTRLATAPEHTA